MRWLHHKKLLALTTFTFLLLYIASSVNAAPYYLTHPTYFPSKVGSYINFNASLLPISFSTLYRNTQTRWTFNDTWMTTTNDTTITVFHQNGWINYTVAGSGTQEINNGSQPTTVFIDGVNKTLGDGWTYASGTVTVTGASSNASLGGAVPPPPSISSLIVAETVYIAGLFSVYLFLGIFYGLKTNKKRGYYIWLSISFIIVLIVLLVIAELPFFSGV